MVFNFKILLLGFAFQTALGEIDCDLPLAKTRKSLSLSSSEACEGLCQADRSTCQEWVFVSGWNRCFLKEGKSSRTVKLIFEAAMKDDAQISLRKDSSGKDLRRISSVTSARDCQKLCQSEKECGSFTYMNGYGDCWLKAPGGRLYAKQFFCGRLP